MLYDNHNSSGCISIIKTARCNDTIKHTWKGYCADSGRGRRRRHSFPFEVESAEEHLILSDILWQAFLFASRVCVYICWPRWVWDGRVTSKKGETNEPPKMGHCRRWVCRETHYTLSRQHWLLRLLKSAQHCRHKREIYIYMYGGGLFMSEIVKTIKCRVAAI